MWYVYTDKKLKLACMCELSQVYVIKHSAVAVYSNLVIHFKTNVKNPLWQTEMVLGGSSTA